MRSPGNKSLSAMIISNASPTAAKTEKETQMVLRSALILISFSIACISIAHAADTPVIIELRKAGINVNTRREGGHAVYVKKAVDLTEDVWKNFEAIDLR